MDVERIQRELREFADEREWEQFHSPKNLVMALSGEVGELIEHFQWLTEEESRDQSGDTDRMAAIQSEVADVAIYLLRLADKMDIDIEKAVDDKLAENASRYTVETSKGSSRKQPRSS